MTIVFPANSSRAAICAVAQSAAPEEIPTNRPSSAAARHANATAESASTSITSSYTVRSRIGGMKLGPIPWIGCPPGVPPLRIGDAAGSTAKIFTSGLRALRT